MSRLPLEPPGAHFRRRRPDGPWLLRLAALAAAATLTLSTSGDVFVLAAALGLAALDVAGFLTAALVGVTVLVRWGTTSLGAVAGAQAVLGPAGLVDPPLAAASAWVAAAALLLAAPPTAAAIPFGIAAGAVVAGPAVSSASSLAVRLGAAASGAVIAAAAGRSLAPWWRSRVALAAAAAAVALAVAA